MLRPDVLRFELKEEIVKSREDMDVRYLKKIMREKCPDLVQDKKQLIMEFPSGIRRMAKPITVF